MNKGHCVGIVESLHVAKRRLHPGEGGFEHFVWGKDVKIKEVALVVSFMREFPLIS